MVTNTSSFLRAVLSILMGEQKPATSGAWTCNLWLQAQLFNHQATNAWYDYCSQITIKHHKYYTNTLNTIRSKGLTCTHYWDQNKLYSEVFIRYDSISYLVHVTSDTKEWLLLSVLSILFDWIITLNGFIKSLPAVGKTDVTILYFVIPKIMADKLFLRVLGNSNDNQITSKLFVFDHCDPIYSRHSIYRLLEWLLYYNTTFVYTIADVILDIILLWRAMVTYNPITITHQQVINVATLTQVLEHCQWHKMFR